MGLRSARCRATEIVAPDAALATKDDEVFRKTVCSLNDWIRAVVVTFSGCPGIGQARHPNWGTTTGPEFSGLEGSGEKGDRTGATRRGRRRSWRQRRAEEIRGSSCTREIALGWSGEQGNLGVNSIPVFFGGRRRPADIRALGAAIFHVHAKPYTSTAELAVRRDRHQDLSRKAERSWLFAASGGHDGVRVEHGS